MGWDWAGNASAGRQIQPLGSESSPAESWVSWAEISSSPSAPFAVFWVFLVFKINLFYLFIFGCVGSSLLHAGFL